MPAQLEWLDQNETILLCRLLDDFGIETYAVLEGQLPMMVREKDHRVDVIFYLTGGASLPPIRGLLREISILLNVMPPNLGLFIGVGSSWFLSNPLSVVVARLLLPMAFRTQSERVRVAGSLDAAKSLIIADRS